MKIVIDIDEQTYNEIKDGFYDDNARTMAIAIGNGKPIKTGHWINSNIPNEEYVCSECGGACWYYDYQAKVAKSKFCPNCGAKMVEPSGDLISRQAVEDAIEDDNRNGMWSCFASDDDAQKFKTVIKELPPVNPQEPKTGHWIADVFIDECSVCGEQTLFFEDQQKNFCPNCGARMVEPRESEE